jgi:hypothetical protein
MIDMTWKNGLDKQSLLIELENIQSQGVTIWLEGIPSTPLSVMDTLAVNESQVYMRDYVTNESGVLTDLKFDKITKM